MLEERRAALRRVLNGEVSGANEEVKTKREIEEESDEDSESEVETKGDENKGKRGRPLSWPFSRGFWKKEMTRPKMGMKRLEWILEG